MASSFTADTCIRWRTEGVEESTAKASLVPTVKKVKSELIIPEGFDLAISHCEAGLREGVGRIMEEDVELAELLHEHGDFRCGYGTPLAWYYEELAHRIAPRGNLSFDFA